ncbi:hypothetical protein DFH09DRAFT_1307804 [Mycena vulgaris]|nr:hypothetical protein DFH09DRAFT_1307804 [Mycena vulgaris]
MLARHQSHQPAPATPQVDAAARNSAYKFTIKSSYIVVNHRKALLASTLGNLRQCTRAIKAISTPPAAPQVDAAARNSAKALPASALGNLWQCTRAIKAISPPPPLPKSTPPRAIAPLPASTLGNLRQCTRAVKAISPPPPLPKSTPPHAIARINSS